jgi:hypothetical protein
VAYGVDAPWSIGSWSRSPSQFVTLGEQRAGTLGALLVASRVSGSLAMRAFARRSARRPTARGSSRRRDQDPPAWQARSGIWLINRGAQVLDRDGPLSLAEASVSRGV